jgi:hypothetical protein
MNDTFNVRRFGLLFRKSLLERPTQMFGLTLLTLVAVLLIYAIIKSIIGFEEAQNISFLLGLIAGGSFLASTVFSYFSSTASGSSFLTLPASHFEKWLCGVLISGILFTAIFLLFFHVTDVLFVQLYHNTLDPKAPFYNEQYNAVQTFELDGFVAGKAYLMYVNFAGAMLVGSLYFNKASFIKVALIICGLYIAGHFINYLMAKLIFNTIDKALPYYCVFIPVGNDFGKVMLPAHASKAVDITAQYIVPAILWGVAYIRLREKEF